MSEPERIKPSHDLSPFKSLLKNEQIKVDVLEDVDASIKQNGRKFKGKLSISQMWNPDHLEWSLSDINLRYSEIEWDCAEQKEKECGAKNRDIRPQFGPCIIESADNRFKFRGYLRVRGKDPQAGEILGWSILPEPSISKISKVVFHIPEYPKMDKPNRIYHPPSPFKDSINNESSWSEIVLEHEGWLFRLQNSKDYFLHVFNDKLLGGIPKLAILGIGELKRSDGRDFPIEEVPNILDALDTYLSFSFMGRTPPILPVGYDTEGNRVCHFVKGYSLQLNRYPFGWVCEKRGELLEECFPGFMKLWSDPDWNAPLQMITDNLITCRFTNDLRAAVANIQTSLEMIAGLWGPKCWSRRKKDKWENLSARRKIRFMLRQSKVPLKVPDGLTLLLEIEKLNRNKTKLGPSIIAKIRNWLIHPSRSNRKKIDKILHEIGKPNDHEQLYNETHQLFNYYITLILLHKMGYQGEYGNRLVTKNRTEYETVPWASSTP